MKEEQIMTRSVSSDGQPSRELHHIRISHQIDGLSSLSDALHALKEKIQGQQPPYPSSIILITIILDRVVFRGRRR